MSYVVLARKYRPKTFDQMVGQEAVVRALSSALKSQRLHHAYLFTGTRGIGKTTVSRILAKSLNCTGADGQGGITASPCGVCSACTEIDADRYVDYVELDAASNRSIDEIRELLERAAYKPSVGRFKVFMIDEAHQLTKDAFNALLKTLEEPPEYLKFVLATTDPERMLPTVLSRCLQFNLRPITPDVVEQHLQHILQAEGVAFDKGSLALLGHAARGSMRDALSLTDQAIAFGHGALTAEGVRSMIGAVDHGYAWQLLQALGAHEAQAVQAQVQVLRESAQSATGALDALTQALQQLALELALPGSHQDAEHVQAITAQAELWDAQEVHLLYSMLLAGRSELSLAPDEYDALLMVFWRFLAFSPSARADSPRPAAALRMGARQAKVAVRPPVAVPVSAPVAAPVAAPASAPVAVPMQAAITAPVAASAAPSPVEPVDAELMSSWVNTVRELIDAQAITALTRELAIQSCLVDRRAQQGEHPGQWTLQVGSESLAHRSLADKLQEALQQHLGRPVHLVVQMGPVHDSIAQRELAARKLRQEQAEATIQSDPLVRQVLEQFPGARIVPGSIQPI